MPTSCGVILQINHWTENRAEFFSHSRLDELIKMIISDHGDWQLIEMWLQLKIDKFFIDFDKDRDEKIVPALFPVYL